MLATTIAIYANPQYGFGFGYPQQYLVMPQNFGYGYLGQGQAGGGQQSYFRAGARVSIKCGRGPWTVDRLKCGLFPVDFSRWVHFIARSQVHFA